MQPMEREYLNPEEPGSIVLMYHRIGSPIVRSIVRGQYVTARVFRWQLRDMISMGYRPATLQELILNPEKRTGHFAVTFDDGYQNVGRLAAPILRDMQIPATIFAVSSAMGKTNEWDVQLGDRVERMLSVEELREMPDIEIGSHTANHAHLTECSESIVRSELLQSKMVLEDTFGREVASFAYPYGEWNSTVRDAVEDAGYRFAAVTARAALTESTDPLVIPRINMRWNTFGHQLRAKIRSAQELRSKEIQPLYPKEKRDRKLREPSHG